MLLQPQRVLWRLQSFFTEAQMLMWVLKQIFNLDKGLGVDPNGG